MHPLVIITVLVLGLMASASDVYRVVISASMWGCLIYMISMPYRDGEKHMDRLARITGLGPLVLDAFAVLICIDALLLVLGFAGVPVAGINSSIKPAVFGSLTVIVTGFASYAWRNRWIPCNDPECTRNIKTTDGFVVLVQEHSHKLDGRIKGHANIGCVLGYDKPEPQTIERTYHDQLSVALFGVPGVAWDDCLETVTKEIDDIREIAELLGVNSTAEVRRHVDQLVIKGYVLDSLKKDCE